MELVPPPEGKNVVGSRRVLTVKIRVKARLVAHGYSQTKGVDYDEVFSPVARQSSVRTLLALSNAHDLEIHQTAFLNGELDCEIYMSQPESCVASDRPEYLASVGYRRSDANGCILIHARKQSQEPNGHINFVILGVYVDDLVPVFNTPALLKAEKDALCTRFDMVDQGDIRYLLGMSIKRDRKYTTLTISQPTYLEKVLKRFREFQTCIHREV